MAIAAEATMGRPMIQPMLMEGSSAMGPSWWITLGIVLAPFATVSCLLIIPWGPRVDAPDHDEPDDIVQQRRADEHDSHPRLHKVKARRGATDDYKGRAERGG